jgi:glutathione synthase/RimK-type ligase-like ATP-grasp enzyme
VSTQRINFEMWGLKMVKIKSFDSFDTQVGFLSSKTKLAWNAYKERADIARKRNVALLQIVAEESLVSKILNDDIVYLKYWDGISMNEYYDYIPEIIYDRLNITEKIRDEIINALEQKNTIFINSPNFRKSCADKLKTSLLLETNQITSPKTYELTQENLKYLLNKKGFVFIKKIISSQGKNQIVIREIAKNDYIIIVSDNNKLKRINGLNNLVDEFNYFIKTNNYLVQEGINVDRLDGRVYDFRAIFQKKNQLRTDLTCFYARVGAPLSEQANIGKKGHPQDPYLIFEEYEKLEKLIKNTGKKVINCFSNKDNIGEIGIDFVFDEDYELYVIEANSKPGSKGIRMLREYNPKDYLYQNKNIIQYEYNNQIRKIWGKKLDLFLSNPITYSKKIYPKKLKNEI